MASGDLHTKASAVLRWCGMQPQPEAVYDSLAAAAARAYAF